MKKTLTITCFSLLTFFGLSGQTVDFEDFNLSAGEYLNGSDGSGGFATGNLFLPNFYNDSWGAWSGWAISATTDTQTPGPTNQYSSITGGGAGGSATYAISFVLDKSVITTLQADVATLQVTNGTYSYLSMRDGDGFAKKFGGEDGNDPDFFLLTIKGWKGGQLVADSVDFYLADYRFSDNSQDYIVDDWQTVDVSGLGDVDSLTFSLSSSDTGQFGMNTPAYFCVDNIETIIIDGLEEQVFDYAVEVFPNPVADQLNISWKEATAAEAAVFDLSGKQVAQSVLQTGEQSLAVGSLPSGMYVLKIQTQEGWTTRRFVKQ